MTVLTRRDREIVRWIGRHGAVQAQHVMTRFSIGRTASYRRLHELVEYGLIRRHRLLDNDAALLTATSDGLRWAELHRLTPARISLVLVPHTIASAALAALLEPDLTDQRLLSDREHRAAERASARPLASAIMGSGGSDLGIYDLARTGRLPHLRIGRALRFSPRDLEAHLAESCRRTNSRSLIDDK
jgi:Helix-turn-helix domain